MVTVTDTDTRLRNLPFATDSELREAAFNHGYRRPNGQANGWLFFRSDTVPNELALAASATHWFLSVEHPGVAAELDLPRATPPARDFLAAYVFETQAEMRAAISRAYHLSRSLPNAPLRIFEEEIAALGETEAEQLVRRRIGQDVFRRALMDYWDGRCPLTGIDDSALLRASHIKPWARCESDAERLDVHNGLLLSAHWDAAFDAGLVSFDAEGRVLVSPGLKSAARAALRPDQAARLALVPEHQGPLAWHRRHLFVVK
jgi:hypothetical protein